MYPEPLYYTQASAIFYTRCSTFSAAYSSSEKTRIVIIQERDNECW
jgi:hypothetical protein